MRNIKKVLENCEKNAPKQALFGSISVPFRVRFGSLETLVHSFCEFLTRIFNFRFSKYSNVILAEKTRGELEIHHLWAHHYVTRG